MNLNELKPTPGSKSAPKRVGRGIGSGLGKTCGKGHKGQKARAGGYHKINFEGGQMPLQRRLPKVGFTSRKSLVTDEIRLHELNLIPGDVVSMESLKAAGLIKNDVKHVKIIACGELKSAKNIVGIRVTKGAKAEIEKAGGKIEG
ncbi:50S ribosomal protein L15 [Legionella sp. W05-934-2]|jgi:large subunit ribosomal protein L15|uniref:50S ribosomal protein L15 n=1 Tax=Legionella sp. W05-934-2 TaxID=1198649 RepID=UPI0034630BFB